MALVAHFFILFSGEKGQVLNSIQKHTFNHSLLDILDFYVQYRGKKKCFYLGQRLLYLFSLYRTSWPF